jgi:hypothetical protein
LKALHFTLGSEGFHKKPPNYGAFFIDRRISLGELNFFKGHLSDFGRPKTFKKTPIFMEVS